MMTTGNRARHTPCPTHLTAPPAPPPPCAPLALARPNPLWDVKAGAGARSAQPMGRLLPSKTCHASSHDMLWAGLLYLVIACKDVMMAESTSSATLAHLSSSLDQQSRSHACDCMRHVRTNVGRHTQSALEGLASPTPTPACFALLPLALAFTPQLLHRAYPECRHQRRCARS